VDKSDFRLENNLQQYIYDNPESIPLYDIKEDTRLLILAREFSTKSGPIDALGVDKEGEIYLIETKLYKNPDKRTVVAQVLDYGASLWSNFRDFGSFIEQVNLHTNKDFNKTLHQRLEDFYEISEDNVNNLLENIRRNFSDGNFKFVVLMDHLHEQLKNLIVFLNNNSEFTIYAVELEYYKHQDFEILIPKLYGSEVKKDLGKSAVARMVLTDEEFINYYQNKLEQPMVEELLLFGNQIDKNPNDYPNIIYTKTPKFLNFYLTTSLNDQITISLPAHPEKDGGGLQVWGSNLNEQNIKSILSDSEVRYENMTPKGEKGGKIARIQLKDINIRQFKELIRKLVLI